MFSGERWHVPEAWAGDSRWVISAFVPRDFGGTSEEQWSSLKELGFPVDGVRSRCAELGDTLGASVRKVDSGKPQCLLEQWEISLPTPFWEHVARVGPIGMNASLDCVGS